jgi:hypothetical protein
MAIGSERQGEAVKKPLAQVAHEKAMPKKASTKAKKKRELRPGQPSVYSSLDDAVEKRLCEYLQAGVPIALACDATGLPRRTFYQWEEFAVQSDDPQNRYRLFMMRVREAQAKGLIRLHLEVRRLDPKWLLARCAREHYPPETHEFFCPERRRSRKRPRSLWGRGRSFPTRLSGTARRPIFLGPIHKAD